eukprot:2473836-Amphidinium_carterae.1
MLDTEPYGNELVGGGYSLVPISGVSYSALGNLGQKATFLTAILHAHRFRSASTHERIMTLIRTR